LITVRIVSQHAQRIKPKLAQSSASVAIVCSNLLRFAAFPGNDFNLAWNVELDAFRANFPDTPLFRVFTCLKSGFGPDDESSAFMIIGLSAPPSKQVASEEKE
jgi:hypothetical protein